MKNNHRDSNRSENAKEFLEKQDIAQAILDLIPESDSHHVLLTESDFGCIYTIVDEIEGEVYHIIEHSDRKHQVLMEYVDDGETQAWILKFAN